jgi:hypothetical protein
MIMLVAYPVFFAANVIKSFEKENLLASDSETKNMSGSQLEIESIHEFDCVTPLILNSGLAVLLAGLWNTQQMMKIGTI